MNEDLFTRLDTYMEYKGLNDNQITVSAGLSVGSLGKQRKGARGLSSDSIAKLLHAYDDLSGDWLLTGRGVMLKGTPQEKEIESPTDKVMSIYKLKTDYFNTDKQLIPLYEISGAAGLVTLFDNQHVQQIPLDFISIPNAPKCDGAVFVRGDSMYPVLKAGDIVCYKHIEKLDDIYWGEMYLLDIDVAGDQYLTFKYVQKSDKGDEYIRLVSQNSHHSPKDVKKEDIKAIALVKVSIRYNTLS